MLNLSPNQFRTAVSQHRAFCRTGLSDDGTNEMNKSMKATLVIPSEHAPQREFRLSPRTGKAGRLDGFRVAKGNSLVRVLTGDTFRDLRDVLGAWIVTDDLPATAAALHLEAREPGVVVARR
jgi:hypothetical protein